MNLKQLKDSLLRVDTAVVGLALWQARTLTGAWLHSPYDRAGWIAFLLWLVPACWQVGRHGDRSSSRWLSAGALILAFGGWIAGLNSLNYLALALALAGRWRLPGRRMWGWLALSVSWMPALGWLGAKSGMPVWLVDGARVGLGLAGLVAGFVEPSGEWQGHFKLGNRFRRYGLWVVLGAVVVLGLMWELAPRADASARLRRLPATGFHLESRTMPLDPVEAEIYHSAKVMKRVYQAGRERFILLAIDGTHDRHAVHDPLYCFRGGGWRVGADRSLKVPGGTARVLELAKDNRTVEVMFWITDGRTRHGSAMWAWWQSTLRRMTFGTSGDEPVLFILQPLPGGTVNWDNVLVAFPELFEI